MNKVIKDHGRLIILAISLSAIGAYFAVPATFGAVKDSGNVIQSITQSNSITAVNTGQYGGAVQANDNTQINEASNTADVNISPSYSGTSDNSAPATTPTTPATTTTDKPATTTSDNTPQKASTDTTTKKPDSSASDNNDKKSTHDDSKLSDSIKNKISELKDKISSEVKQKVSDAEKKASSSQDSTKNNN